MNKLPFAHRIKKPFTYTSAVNTNVALTIQRARKAIEEAERPATNVRPLTINKRKAAA